jgi:hypothetical protein
MENCAENTFFSLPFHLSQIENKGADPAKIEISPCAPEEFANLN